MLCTTQDGATIYNLTENTLLSLAVEESSYYKEWTVSVELIGDDGDTRGLGTYSTEKLAYEVVNAIADHISENLPFYVMPADRKEEEEDAADQPE